MKKHSFVEYLNTRGKTEEKPKVDPKADQIDMPKPKAKSDPHHHRKCDCGPVCVCGPDCPGSKDKQPQVKEYLDGRGKLIEKPSTSQDYPGPDPTAPPKSGNWPLSIEPKGPKASRKPQASTAPYRAPTAEGAAGRETGLGDEGAKPLVYEPKTDVAKDTEVVPTWDTKAKKEDPYKVDTMNPKQPQVKEYKTNEFLKRTKDMDLREFTEFMLKERACGKIEDVNGLTVYKTGEVHPLPAETARYLADLAHKNPNVFDHFVREVEGNGDLQLLKEAVAPPIGVDIKKKDIEPEDDEEMADLDDEDLGDEDLGDEDLGDEDLGAGLGDEDLEPEEDAPMFGKGDDDGPMFPEEPEDDEVPPMGLEDEEDLGDEDLDDEELEDEDLEDEEMEDEEMEDDEEEEEGPLARFKKRFERKPDPFDNV
jgi:hypothetical protein